MKTYLSEEEIEAKRFEIQKRWESLGFTEGLSGCLNEKLRELFESEAKELLKDSDEEPQFPCVVKAFAPIIDEKRIDEMFELIKASEENESEYENLL
jgi:hypothetical protein